MREEDFFEESRLNVGSLSTELFKLFIYILFNIFVTEKRGSKLCVSYWYRALTWHGVCT